jgi:hypothetical protein
MRQERISKQVKRRPTREVEPATAAPAGTPDLSAVEELLLRIDRTLDLPPATAP